MKKKSKKIRLDNVMNTVKKGKDFWDAHGAELTEAVKEVIPKKGKKISAGKLLNVARVGIGTFTDGEKVVSEATGLFSAPKEDSLATKEMPVEEPECLPDAEMEMAPMEEDTFFEDKLGSLMDTVKNTNPTNPQEVIAAIAALTQVSNEIIRYVAEQETKREEIRARRDVAIAQIHAMSDNIKLYLEKTFDERSAVFAKQFECVDAALRDGNTEMLALTLNNINSLAASSPFKNLSDINQVQQALGSEDTEWDI